jgi:hypothetical protein
MPGQAERSKARPCHAPDEGMRPRPFLVIVSKLRGATCHPRRAVRSGIKAEFSCSRSCVDPGGAMIGIVRIEIIRSITKKPESYSSRNVAYRPISCSSEKIDASEAAVEYAIANDRSLGLMKPHCNVIVPKTNTFYDMTNVVIRATGKIKPNAMAESENFAIPYSNIKLVAREDTGGRVTRN